jgi:elongation factor P hydroxylase
MKLTTRIWITTKFVALHYWKNAPDEVAYLRQPHRHQFHVRVTADVSHNDRDVEFFQFKKEVEDYVKRHLDKTLSERSCEMMANELLLHLLNVGYSVHSVEVSEDGENGAVVEFGEDEDSVRKAGTMASVKIHEDETPALKKRADCFEGIEVEGPWKGNRTLFVPETALAEDIPHVLSLTYRVVRVYYGAGNYPVKTNVATLDKLLELFRPEQFTVEIQSWSELSDYLREKLHDFAGHIVSNAPDDRSNKRVDYVKTVNLENRTVEWCPTATGFVITSSLDDPEYGNDRMLPVIAD